MMTNIKICGLTTLEDVVIINEEMPEFVGFVLFFPKSKRNITTEKAKELLKHINTDIKKTAVVVSPSSQQVMAIQELDFDYIQIHGILSEEVYNIIKLPIIKAFNGSDIKEYEHYHTFQKIVGFVFDSAIPGSGKTFDWSIIKKIDRQKKLLFLAGGIDVSNVLEAIEEVKPDVIDVSSSVEGSIGKDQLKVKEFIRMVRNGK